MWETGKSSHLHPSWTSEVREIRIRITENGRQTTLLRPYGTTAGRQRSPKPVAAVAAGSIEAEDCREIFY